ncbi:MAG: SusC/RagA family TonB-linked outer membrane protein, partial [Bacteroidota bacterium]
RRPIGSQRFPDGMYREQNITFREINTDFLLSYNKRFNDFSTVVSVGANRMTQTTSENLIEGRGLAIPAIYTLGNINVQPILNRFNGEKRINSVYAFANLGYKDFLYLDLTVRNDWSSTLPRENNAYFYPAASLSFIPSELINFGRAVDYLKVRFNVARVGNDTDPFQLTRTYQFATLPNSVTNPSLLPYANLRPVQTDSYEFGLKGNLFKNRLGFDFTYYNTKSKDQIISAGISEASGFSSTVINAGEIESEGIELALNATPVRMENGFQWDVGVNFTRNRSYVNELAPGIETFIVGFGPAGATVEARPAGRMGDIYGEVFLRNPEGEIVFDENGLPVIDPERKTIGNYNPDYLVGLTTGFQFKGFFANAVLDIRRGGIIYSYTNAIGAESGLLTHSLPGRETGLVGDGVALNAEGDYIPNETNVSPETWYYGGFYRRSNIEANSFAADFMKLRELSVGYRLPQPFAKKLGLNNLSIAFVGHNVALWTDVPNIDPEAHALNGGTLVPGFEVTQLPSAQSFGVKLNAGFYN